jgi:hypothetical protein
MENYRKKFAIAWDEIGYRDFRSGWVKIGMSIGWLKHERYRNVIG